MVRERRSDDSVKWVVKRERKAEKREKCEVRQSIQSLVSQLGEEIRERTTFSGLHLSSRE